MSRNLLPSRWKTERLSVEDSALEEAQELQRINDAVPQTSSWMESQENPECSMLLALKQGVLPPTQNRSKEYFRLQSIRKADSGDLVGFLAMYHGFPEDDVFWINAVTLHPEFQGKGYGTELLKRLVEIVGQLGSYTHMRSYVSLENWRSLRLCVKVGLDRMVEIAVAKVHSEEPEGHVLVEKSFIGT